MQEENPDWNIPAILEKTGINNRFIAAPEETAVDLALTAGKKILRGLPDVATIDLLILVTQSPDYILPTSACILQDKLGLSKSCMAFDINLGCSGFVYALSIASSLIESGVASKGIIICADTYSKYIGRSDRTCRPLFSDGAAATLIEASNLDCVGPFEFGTDGAGYDRLIVKAGGARYGKKLAAGYNDFLEMSGSEVFLFTMQAVPRCITKLLERIAVKLEDVDLVMFHQASKLVIDNLIRIMLLDKDKVFTNYQDIGNTVSASIPIGLKDAQTQGRLKDGDTVLIAGFGVGLSWGATLVKWSVK